MVKTLTFVRTIDLDWYNSIEEIINYIDNEIRPLRNRLIHDSWYFDKGGEHCRIIKKPASVAYSASRTKVLRLDEQEITTADDVLDVSECVLSAIKEISRLEDLYFTALLARPLEPELPL